MAVFVVWCEDHVLWSKSTSLHFCLCNLKIYIALNMGLPRLFRSFYCCMLQCDKLEEYCTVLFSRGFKVLLMMTYKALKIFRSYTDEIISFPMHLHYPLNVCCIKDCVNNGYKEAVWLVIAYLEISVVLKLLGNPILSYSLKRVQNLTMHVFSSWLYLMYLA